MNDFNSSPGEDINDAFSSFENADPSDSSENEERDDGALLENQEEEEHLSEEQEEKASMEKADRIVSTEVPDLLSGLTFSPTTLLNKEYDPEKILEKKDVQVFLAKYKNELSDEAYEYLEEQVRRQIEREVKPRWEIEKKIADDRYRKEAKQDVLKAMQFTEKDLKDEALRKGGLQAFEKLMKKRGKEAISKDNPLKDEIEAFMNEQMGGLYAEWKNQCDKKLSEADMKSMNVINSVKNQIQTVGFSRSELVDNMGFWKDKTAFQSFMKSKKMPGFEKSMEEIKGLDSKKHDELTKVVDGLLGDQGYEKWKTEYVDVQLGRLDATKQEVDKTMTLTPEDIANEDFANNPKAFQEAMFRKMSGIDPSSLENEQEAELKKYITELSDKKYREWQKLYSGEMETEQTKGQKQLTKSLKLSKKEMLDEKYDDPKEFEKLMKQKGIKAMKEMPVGVRVELEKGMGAQIKQLHNQHLKERKKIVEKQERDEKDNIFKKSRLNVSFAKLDKNILERGTSRMNQLRKLPELRAFLGGNNTLFEPLMHIWTVMLDEAGGEAGFQALRQRLHGVKDKSDPQELLSAMSGTSAARDALKKARKINEQAWHQFEMGMAGLNISWKGGEDEGMEDSEEGTEELNGENDQLLESRDPPRRTRDGLSESEESEGLEMMETIDEDIEGEEEQLKDGDETEEEADDADLQNDADAADEEEDEEKVEDSTVIAREERPSQSREKQEMENDQLSESRDPPRRTRDRLSEFSESEENEGLEMTETIDEDVEDEESEEVPDDTDLQIDADATDEEEQELDEENVEEEDETELEEGELSEEEPHIDDMVNELEEGDDQSTVIAREERPSQSREEQEYDDGSVEEPVDSEEDLSEETEETEEDLEAQESEREEQEMLQEVMEALEREHADEDALEEEQEILPLNEVAIHQDIDLLERMMKEKDRLDEIMRRVIEDEETIDGIEQLMTELQQMLMLECLNATLDHNRLFDAMQKKLAQERWWEEQGYVITDEPDFDVFMSKYSGDVSMARALQVFCYYVNLVTGSTIPRKVIADKKVLKMLVKNPRELMSDWVAQFREFSDLESTPVILGFEVSSAGDDKASLTVVIKGKETQLKQNYEVDVKKI